MSYVSDCSRVRRLGRRSMCSYFLLRRRRLRRRIRRVAIGDSLSPGFSTGGRSLSTAPIRSRHGFLRARVPVRNNKYIVVCVDEFYTTKIKFLFFQKSLSCHIIMVHHIIVYCVRVVALFSVIIFYCTSIVRARGTHAICDMR